MTSHPTTISGSSPTRLQVVMLLLAVLMTVVMWFLDLSVFAAFATTSGPDAVHCRDGAVSYVHSRGAACQTHGGIQTVR